MLTRLSGRLNKEGVEGQSDRRDLISLVQASVSHCLLCRHTTDPQSLPSKLVSEMERDEREKGLTWSRLCWEQVALGKNCDSRIQKAGTL